MNKKVFKISDEQIRKMYLEGNSLNDIASIALDTKGLMALRARLHELGVSTNISKTRYRYKISKICKKYSLNEHVFDVIDNQEKAYWLGFLMADGYNHLTKSCVALRLKAEDREILEKFKLFLLTDCPIYEFNKTTEVNHLQRKYYELNICSPYFSDKLAEQGCIQNKTFNLQFPNIPKPLYNHFIRGYFDGDGCISIKDRLSRRKLNGSCMTYQFSIVGTKNLIEKIQSILSEEASLNISYYQNKRSPLVYTLQCNGKNIVIQIMNYLYKDASIYLARKHNLYLKYCNSAE